MMTSDSVSDVLEFSDQVWWIRMGVEKDQKRTEPLSKRLSFYRVKCVQRGTGQRCSIDSLEDGYTAHCRAP